MCEAMCVLAFIFASAITSSLYCTIQHFVYRCSVTLPSWISAFISSSSLASARGGGGGGFCRSLSFRISPTAFLGHGNRSLSGIRPISLKRLYQLLHGQKSQYTHCPSLKTLHVFLVLEKTWDMTSHSLQGFKLIWINSISFWHYIVIHHNASQLR